MDTPDTLQTTATLSQTKEATTSAVEPEASVSKEAAELSKVEAAPAAPSAPSAAAAPDVVSLNPSVNTDFLAENKGKNKSTDFIDST